MELVHVVAGSLQGQGIQNLIRQGVTLTVCLHLDLVETVLRNTIPDLILHDMHANFLQLLTQLSDVIADNPVMDIHVGSVIEHGKRTADVDFQSCCDVLCFLFCLLTEHVIKVLQDGHILRFGVLHVFLIDQSHTTVDDGLLNRSEAFLSANDQFT